MSIALTVRADGVVPQLIVQIVKELRLADPEGWKNCHQFRDSTTILSDSLQTQNSLDQHSHVCSPGNRNSMGSFSLASLFTDNLERVQRGVA